MYCTNCGQKNDISDNFCAKCGQRIAVESKQTDTAEHNIKQTENQKDILAKEIIIFFRLAVISLVIAFISAFIIYQINSDNLSGITSLRDRKSTIEANQRGEIKDKVPKVFVCSLLVLTIGRYIIKGLTWANKRSKK